MDEEELKEFNSECKRINALLKHLSNKITRLNARTDELFIEEQKLFHKAHKEGLDFDYDLREWGLRKECE